MDISKEWTAQERLDVIEAILSKMSDFTLSYEDFERIDFLCTASSNFLENNRDRILGKQ